MDAVKNNLVLPDTIEDCHAVIKDMYSIICRLLKEAEERTKRFNALEARLEKVEAENRILRERLNLNSTNSSKSPSSDKTGSKKKNKKKRSSGKPSGGQPGHRGSHRELLPLSEVDETISCSLNTICPDCGESTVEPSGDYVRHQVHELPTIKLDVTEYQLTKGQCTTCKHHHVADLPEGVPWGITGPRLTGFMSVMVSDYQLSRRQLQHFLHQHFNFKISLGTIFNKQRLVNIVLEKPVETLLPVVKSNHCNMDETTHNRDGQRHWLWAMISREAAYFEIVSSRGKKVAKRLLEGFQNILTTDRYSAYSTLDSSQRQLCWAHLKRDFTRFSEKTEPVVRRFGKECLEVESQLFSLWHAFKNSEINRSELIRRAEPLKKRLGISLEKGRYTAPELRIARFCNNLLKDFFALWTFLEVEGVEPTNNAGERALRPSVIWRKKYFATRSDYGSQFVARTASVKMTCQFQAKNAFSYMTQAITNYFLGRPAPPIISST